jgi:hypothetical protein
MFSALHLIKAILSFGLLIIFALVGLQMGLQQRQRFLDHQKRFLSPVTITMEEFCRTLPAVGRFRITGAMMRADKSGYTRPNNASENGSDGTAGIRKVATPVYSREQIRSGDPAALILVTDNLQLRRIVNEMRRAGLTSPRAGIDDSAIGGHSELKLIAASASPTTAAWVKANSDRIVETRTIEGSVRYFVDLDPDVRDVCRAVAQRVGKRHVILQEGIIPSTEGDGTLCIVLSLLFLFVFSIGMLRLLVALMHQRP